MDRVAITLSEGMDFPRARQFFYREVRQPVAQIDLAKAALYIAQEEYPTLDPAAYLNALDTMAAEIEERLPAERYPLRIIQSINRYLYHDLRFVGNRDNYYDPRNSFLNQVIDRRTGIPITLSLVYLEVARRLDFPMIGVGMPGKFLIRPDVTDMEIFVDPFNQGETMFPEDCQAEFAKLYGASVPFQPTFLNPVSTRQFLARMLTNLKLIYFAQSDALRALAATERILVLFPEAPLELRDRGLLYYHLNRLGLARADLERYLLEMPDAEDGFAIQQVLNQIALRSN